jgi:periplasmic divalent cation tolerance protein
MSKVSIVLVTAGTPDEATVIGRTLVEERLVACVSIVPRIRSIYWWKGEICDEEEYLLVMKTQSDLFPAVQARVRQMHSYEVPEIIAFQVGEGLPEYLKWVLENTGFAS